MTGKTFICLFGLLLFGCSNMRYKTADNLLKRNNYKSALREYVKIAKKDGPLTISKNTRALAGAMIAYYNLKEYRNSFALSKRILSLNQYNSCAILYAGLCLEHFKKRSIAKKIFRYYSVLSKNDPYYRFIKAKYTTLVQEEMRERAKLAIKMEESISPDQIEENTIAVLYFLNVMEDPEWSTISKGLAEMLITDLSQVRTLKVLERIEIQKMIEEMKIGMSGLADEKTVPRMGRLLKAKTLVNGAYSVKSGKNIAISSDLVDITSEIDFHEQDFSGNIVQLFEIEKKIVFGILDELGIDLTTNQKKNINKFATKNFEAFKAYCIGLDNYDRGNYKVATSYFQDALKKDPNFALAKDIFEVTDALGVLAQGNLPMMQGGSFNSSYASTSMSIGNTRSSMLSSTKERLQQLSNNLDLGYLPGNDSRNGSSEIIREEAFIQGDDWRPINEKLPEPPKPPTSSPTSSPNK